MITMLGKDPEHIEEGAGELSYKARRNIILVAGILLISSVWALIFLNFRSDRRAERRSLTISALSDSLQKANETINKLSERQQEDQEFFSAIRKLVLLPSTGDPAQRQAILDQLRAQEAAAAARNAQNPPPTTTPPTTAKQSFTPSTTAPRGTPGTTSPPTTRPPPPSSTSTTTTTILQPSPPPPSIPLPSLPCLPLVPCQRKSVTQFFSSHSFCCLRV